MIALWRKFAPGLITAGVIALAATFVSEHYGGPQFLYALFFGISFNFLAEDPRTRAGIELAARTLLRLGVALLGARITLEQIASLGATTVLLVVVAVLLTIAFGAWLARLTKQSAAEGLLTGGAVAICGASAALAISAVLPRTERSSRFTLLTVVGVTLLSTVAMIVYPLVVRLAQFDAGAAGVFLGGTIHDVAQVVGAGYIISPEAGANATFVKLLRVAMLLPVVLVFSFMYRGRGGKVSGTPLVPWFLVAFAALAAASSAGWLPAPAVTALADVSRGCLVTAIAALGVKTSFQEFASLGWRPVALLVGETLFLAALVLAALFMASAHAQDRPGVLKAVAMDIEALKADFPQLHDFSAARHLRAEPPSISYAFRTRAPEKTGGWTSGVPSPEADGVWFHIDLHDPGSNLQLHTQPVTASLCLGESRVSFLMREGRETRSLYAPIWSALAKQGARECARPGNTPP